MTGMKLYTNKKDCTWSLYTATFKGIITHLDNKKKKMTDTSNLHNIPLQ